MTQFTILIGGKFQQLLLSVPKDAYYINGGYHRLSTVDLAKLTEGDYRAEVVHSIPYGDLNYNPFYYVESIKSLIEKAVEYELDHVYIITSSFYKGLGFEVIKQICGFINEYSTSAILFDNVEISDYITDVQFAAVDSFEESEKTLRHEYITKSFENALSSYATFRLSDIQFYGTCPFQPRPLNFNRIMAGSFCYLCTVDGEGDNSPIFMSSCNPRSINVESLSFIHHVDFENNEIAISGPMPKFNCLLVLTSTKPTQMPNNMETDATLRLSAVSPTIVYKTISFNDWKQSIASMSKEICGLPKYVVNSPLSGVGGHPLRVRRRF